MTVTVKNMGASSVLYGDVEVTPPDGSILLSLPSECKNYGSFTRCEISKIDGTPTGASSPSSASVSISFNLPDMDGYASGDTEEFSSRASFQAPGMDEAQDAPDAKLNVKKT